MKRGQPAHGRAVIVHDYAMHGDFAWTISKLCGEGLTELGFWVFAIAASFRSPWNQRDRPIVPSVDAVRCRIDAAVHLFDTAGPVTKERLDAALAELQLRGLVEVYQRDDGTEAGYGPHWVALIDPFVTPELDLVRACAGNSAMLPWWGS